MMFGGRAALVAALFVAARASRDEVASNESCDTDDEEVLLQVNSLKPEEKSPFDIHHHPEYEPIGCFARAAGDVISGRSVFEDRTCMIAATKWSQYNASQPCRSGLPWYRLLQKKEQGYGDCNVFCVSKGFDISGIVMMHSVKNNKNKVECRCGATAENLAAWHLEEGGKPPEGMMLSDELKVEEDDERCEIYAWKYKGALDEGAIPLALLDMSFADTAYTDAVATGTVPEDEEKEEEPEYAVDPETGDMFDPNGTIVNDGSNIGLTEMATWFLDDGHRPELGHFSNLSLAQTRGLCKDANPSGLGPSCAQLAGQCKGTDQTGDFIRAKCPLTCKLCTQNGGWMPCYPANCAGSAWKTKAADGNVYVNYFWGKGIDAARKKTFAAATAFYKNTCVKFVQKSPSTKPAIQVMLKDPSSCCSGVGFPGKAGTITLNMGWCKDVKHAGNIAHELGHALGMQHENGRPDAYQKMQTPAGAKGPYITVFWSKITGSWKSQYLFKDNAYVGSAKKGYDTYDYGSIMHYAAQGKMAAKGNAANTAVMGNRKQLSCNDINQINDMYQCAGRGNACAGGGAAAGGKGRAADGAAAGGKGRGGKGRR